jgi:membrane associated rhomboid family serine protease
MSITVIIIIITCLISLTAFNNEKVFDDLIFNPPAITYNRQYYRFFTCGLIHANYMHLGFNMYSLYLFGEIVEPEFGSAFGAKGKMFYLLMYVTALMVCLLPTYWKNRTNYNYRSLGASGAVSAVVFAFIFFDPTLKLGLIFLPRQLSIPGFIFGFLYLGISTILDRRGGGNINHSAHIWGAIYGIVFLVVMGYAFSNYRLLDEFVDKVKTWSHSF